MSALVQDVRYAVRMLARSPGFAIVALLVLALGIGSNTALFSVVNAVLLEPLPYPGSARLIQIQREFPRGRSDAVSISQYLFWRDNNHSLATLALLDGQGGGINLIEGDRPERIPSIRVSWNFFDVLQVPPQLGRKFEPPDSEPGATKVAVISDGLWRRRFNADKQIVGRMLNLSGENYTVVGVMAPGFDFKTHADIWTPLTLTFDPQDVAAVYYTIGRLAEGETVASAQADFERIDGQLAQAHPALVAEGSRPFVRTHLDQVVGNVRPVLMVLLGAVGLVLLIACANIANLLLARATGRQREMALRATLGASRTRLVRQLLTESAMLALAGGAVGVAFAHWGTKGLMALSPESLPRLDSVRIDGAVLGFTIVATLATGVLFGLMPALYACRVDLHESLKEGTTGAGIGTKRGRARGILVVGEIALALMLLIGAGLLIDSFVRLMRVDPGFDDAHVLTMKMSFAGVQDMTTQRFIDTTRQVIERLEPTPGIEAAATISTLPLEHGLMTFFRLEGRTNPDGSPMQGAAQWRLISPNYFNAMGMPLLQGRTFDERDVADAPSVVIVNRALARQYFPDAGDDVVGRRLVTGPPDAENPYSVIVGLVADIREITLDRDPPPTVYSPASQAPDQLTAFVANVMPTCLVFRTTGDPLSFGEHIRRQILAVNSQLPVSDIRTMGDIMATSVAARRFNTLLLAIFAGLALLLALVGIYGVMSYSVAQRTREIGVRMALGANRADTLRLVLGQGLRLAVIGIIIGIAGALALTRLLESMLYEITATDPKTFAIVAIILLVVAAAACLLPALRAMRVDPMAALRTE